MTKRQLIAAIAKRLHLPQREVKPFVHLVFREMKEALAKGQRVHIDSFGTFYLHHRPLRHTYRIHTRTIGPVGGNVVPAFRPFERLTRHVRKSVHFVHPSKKPKPRA